MDKAKTLLELIAVGVGIVVIVLGIAKWIASTDAAIEATGMLTEKLTIIEPKVIVHDEVTKKLADVTVQQQQQLTELIEARKEERKQASIFCRHGIWPKKYCDTINIPEER